MRIVIVADPHCGSESGLTPFPKSKLQRQLYNRWADCIQHFGGRPDILICNGDSSDGCQDKGASEADSDHIPAQVFAAATLLSEWRPKQIYIVGGTHYHTSAARGRVDFEELLAMILRSGKFPQTTFHRKLNLIVNGWFRLQCRHKIGGSSIPHGAATAPAKSKAWGIINAYGEGKKAPHLSVFSHTHRWNYDEDVFGATMITPCWQAIGSDHGDRACDGHIDLGAVQLTIGKTEAEGWSWQKRLYPAAVVDRTVKV